jgi:hypothetical protein
MREFLIPIIEGYVDVLYPLRKSLSSIENFELFLVKYGWDAQLQGNDLDAINDAFNILPLIQEVNIKLDIFINGANTDRVIAAYEVVDTLKNVIAKSRNLSSLNTSLPFPLNQQNFWEEISSDLFSDLLATYLEKEQPIIYGLLLFSCIIEYDKQNPSGNNRVPYTKTIINFNKFGDFFTSPFDQFKDNYSWDSQQTDFNHFKLLKVLERILLAFKLPTFVQLPRASAANDFLDLQQIDIQQIRELYIPIIDGVAPVDNAYWRIGLVMLPIPNPILGNGKISGLALIPLLEGELSTKIHFSKEISLKLVGAFESGNDLYIKIYPNNTAVVTTLPNDIKSSLTLSGNPYFPWIIIGAKDSSRVELGGFEFKFAIEGSLSDPEVLISLSTGSKETHRNPKLSFVYSPSGSDNFLSKILGENKFSIDFQSKVSWSSKKGFSFNGSPGFKIALPIHFEIGPIKIGDILIQMKNSNIDGVSNPKADIGINVSGVLGPLSFIIENTGTSLNLPPVKSGEKGLLGSHDLTFGFKSPNGIGINIDTDAVKGGGYLYINTEEGRYAGVAGLSIKDKIKLSAFGLINTKFPDGRKGYSFLFFVSAEFSPVQLGFGFTLNGVGGIVGIHRSVNIDKLRAGVKTKAYDQLLFPENPVENALEIIADLEAIFPVSEGRYVFGIMGKIGWGSPTLITIDLGLIIEVPSPVKLAILGVVKAILPDEQKAVLKLHVNFLGVIDFGKKQLSFDATIYDSRLLTFSLAGDMAMRLSWGSNSNFLMSVGGFHPSYQPPPQLISMKRLTLNLLGGDNPRLTLTTYFAVTSNTVQFGAKVELYVKVASKLTAEGGFGFDALFQFNPFYMKIMAAAYLAIKWSGDEKFSISLSASLEGPKPWNVDGVAEIKIFFIKYKVKVQKTWGQPQDSPLPSVSVTPMLVEAMKKVENWSSELASGKQQLVTLRKIVTEESIMLPEGVLVISQKVLPLNLNIQLFGTQEVGDGGQHAIADFYINGNIETSKTYVKEDFVPAHFRKMSETEKLSGPSFQKYDGGIRIDGMNKLQGSDIKSKEIEYELIISVPEPPLEDQDPIIPIVPIEKPKIKEMVEVHQAMVKGSKAGQSSLSASKNIAPLAPKPIVVKEEEYGVVKISDLTLVESSALCASFTEAQDYYLAKVVEDIAWKNKLKIIPKFEIQTA